MLGRGSTAVRAGRCNHMGRNILKAKKLQLLIILITSIFYRQHIAKLGSYTPYYILKCRQQATVLTKDCKRTWPPYLCLGRLHGPHRVPAEDAVMADQEGRGQAGVDHSLVGIADETQHRHISSS